MFCLPRGLIFQINRVDELYNWAVDRKKMNSPTINGSEMQDKLRWFVLGFILAGCDAGQRETKIPSFIKICRRSDPNLNDCVKDSVEKIRPYLKKGIPELGIPGCEPLLLPEITLNQGKGSVSVQSNYKNMKVWGPSQFVIRSLKLDTEKDKVKIKLLIPRLEMRSNYTINGRILTMPIAGNGISEGNYTAIEASVLMEGERANKEGKEYFNVKDISVKFTIGHASIHMTNLFNGDKELGKTMNEFLNDNWKNVAEEIQPILEKTVGDLFKKFSNKIYQRYPLDQLLPP